MSQDETKNGVGTASAKDAPARKLPVKRPRAEMPSQDPRARAHNWSEVALGYTEDLAVGEAERCLQCKTSSCREGCPVEVRIPEFVAKVRDRDFKAAYELLKTTNSLPAICGRVCPQETQCESKCLLGKKGEPLAIGRLERFVSDWAMAQKKEKPAKVKPNGKKVAIVGSGPAGLTCAGDLGKKGYEVTIFEALHAPGGVLIYGIPEFRLPKAIVAAEIENLQDLGVTIRTDVVVGRTITVDELFEEGFDAVFLGTGAGLPMFMKIPGETLNGVYSANEFLTRTNLMKAYLFPEWDTPIKVGKCVAVIGSGNVAMDSVRCSLRLGAEKAMIVYRRSEAEMPARKEELEHAKEEGVVFHTLTNPVRILGDADGWVTGMECVKMELGEPDASGRRRPVPIEGSNFVIDCDTVVMALGTTPNPLVSQTTPGLEIDKHGCLVTRDENGLTTRDLVWAGGDAVTGAATVILAMGAGKKAAAAIDKALRG